MNARLEGDGLAQAALAEGEVTLALQALQHQVRVRPDDVELRIFLFQLLCVQGQWRRARAQLDLCVRLDPGLTPMADTYGEALACELVREAVFSGRTTPLVLGRPTPWVAMLIEALAQDAQGHGIRAQELRARAFEEAPAIAGTLDGEPFDWIADADSRLGPVLEVILDGRYGWLPFEELASLHAAEPHDLRDVVWAPVELGLARGGSSVALLPTCYAGTREQARGALKLARSTEWRPLGRDQYAGLGQRLLATSSSDASLLDVRELLLG